MTPKVTSLWAYTLPDETNSVGSTMCPESEGVLREPTLSEYQLLGRLVSSGFAGSDQLAEQLPGLLVSNIDSDGSLRLRPVRGGAADVVRRIPVEATYADAGGGLVHVLLHVIDGQLDELEIYREDSGPVSVGPTEAIELEIDPWRD